jgi:hypothetical protein
MGEDGLTTQAAVSTWTGSTGQRDGRAGAVASEGDMEVLGREPKRSHLAPLAAAGLLVVVLVAYAAPLAVSMRPQQEAELFNLFVSVEDACDQDGGSLVTTDPRGTPMAFATPDGPQRYWCVSRDYLTAIGHSLQDPPPPVQEIPSQYKWLWPRTSYGQ